jgi:drug/metabolite transporter (DMT)-like permease
MILPVDVTLLVLVAALLHAAWNALVKSSPDKLLDMVTIIFVPGVLAFIALPFVPLPDRASWPWLATSVGIHTLYYLAVVGAYRHGDLSHVYPLMRGSAPVLVALASLGGLVDQLSGNMWAGVLLISLGIIAPPLSGRGAVGFPRRSTQIAAANAVIIASYTLIDGVGTRLSGNAISYGQWLFFLSAIPFTMFALAWRGRAAVSSYLRKRWTMGLIGGGMSMASYLIVLWAMTKAPVAAVAALRETSVVFAAIIGCYMLREGLGALRIAGAVVVLAGIVVLRL